MRKKWFGSILVLSMILLFSGCSLAKDDAGKEVLDSEKISQDRLIGVVVTEEHLDLFDFESFLNDNINQIIKGKDVDGSMDKKYQQAIYATIDKHGSNKPHEWDFAFEGVTGYALFAPTMCDGQGNEFKMTTGGDSFSDVNTHYKVQDENAEEVHITATLYVQAGVGSNEDTFYLNPVHQTKEGDIYVGTGNGFGSNRIREDGNEMSSRLDETCNYTENGITKMFTGSVEVKFITKNAPSKITLYQMNEKHEVVREESFTPEEVPEEMKTEEGTVYILVETETQDQVGKKSVDREVFEAGEEGNVNVTTFYPQESGILIKHNMLVTF